LSCKSRLIRGFGSLCCNTLCLGLRSLFVHLPLQLSLKIILLLLLGTLLGLELALDLFPLPRQFLFLTKIFLLFLPLPSFLLCFLELHLPEKLCLQFIRG
jgi:hypothetical protein